MSTHNYNTRLQAKKSSSAKKAELYQHVDAEEDHFYDALAYYDDELKHSQDVDHPRQANPTLRVERYTTLASLFGFYLTNINRVKRWGPNTQSRLLDQIESLLNKQIPKRLKELEELLALSTKEEVQQYELKRLVKVLEVLQRKMLN